MVHDHDAAAPKKNSSPLSATSVYGCAGAMRGSPGPGQSSTAPQQRPSSAQPLQSLSSLSQTSGSGPIDPTHGPHEPNSAPWHVCLPSVHAPTLCLPGGPWKHECTSPGVHEQISSTWPSQLSSRPLPVPSVPHSSTAPQPALAGSGVAQLMP